MHEISLVRNIFKIIEDEFPGKAKSVRVIHLSVGLLSNVQPLLIQSAFQAVIDNEKDYSKASLQVEVLPILIYCSECNKTTGVKDYKFVCGSCGKPAKDIVQGEEVLINRVEFTD